LGHNNSNRQPTAYREELRPQFGTSSKEIAFLGATPKPPLAQERKQFSLHRQPQAANCIGLSVLTFSRKRKAPFDTLAQRRMHGMNHFYPW
jgi:hypothetical protein